MADKGFRFMYLEQRKEQILHFLGGRGEKNWRRCVWEWGKNGRG